MQTPKSMTTLSKKMKDGETLTRDEKKRKGDLEDYFKDNYPAAEINEYYDYEADLNCEEEDNKDSEWKTLAKQPSG